MRLEKLIASRAHSITPTSDLWRVFLLEISLGFPPEFRSVRLEGGEDWSVGIRSIVSCDCNGRFIATKSNAEFGEVVEGRGSSGNWWLSARQRLTHELEFFDRAFDSGPRRVVSRVCRQNIVNPWTLTRSGRRRYCGRSRPIGNYSDKCARGSTAGKFENGKFRSGRCCNRPLARTR